MWIEPRGFNELHTRGNTEAHRLQDPAKWVPFGVGAIDGQSAPSLRVLDSGEAGQRRDLGAAGDPSADPAEGPAAAPPPKPAYAPGEEPRPRDGEPTGSAHGELL
jgi:hypothetical protein